MNVEMPIKQEPYEDILYDVMKLCDPYKAPEVTLSLLQEFDIYERVKAALSRDPSYDVRERP